MRNSVQLIGRLSRDIEFKTTEKGDLLARTTLGTREVQQNLDGEKTIDLQWHQLIGWGGVAEMMKSMLAKGKAVAINGRLIHRSYLKNGEKVFRTEVLVNEFMLIQ